MDSMLEAVQVVVGDPPSPPTSLSVRRGEILGLLVPPDRPRMPLLRALAGIERPLLGAVRYPTRVPRVELTGWESLSDALELHPDVLLVDGECSDVREAEARGLWARLGAEREYGTAVVVATEVEDQAYRSDHVCLVMWQQVDFARALQDLGRRMHQLTSAFLGLLQATELTPTAAVAARLRRLNRAAKDLLAEARRRAHDTEQVLEVMRVGSELAADSVDDRVLDRLIERAQDI